MPAPAFLARALGIVLFSQVAVGALNDYVDRSVDARTQPDKPIPAGLVPPAYALLLTAGSIVGLIILGSTFGRVPLLLAAVGTGGGLAYDVWLKPTPFSFLGYVVAFLCLVTWIWVIVGRFGSWFFLVYPPGGLLLTTAHLANSLPDIETDRRLGQRGLAAILGPETTLNAILLFYSAGILDALALAAIARSIGASLFAVASFVLLSAIWLLKPRAVTHREAQKLVFRLVAPGVGLLALSSLISLADLTR
jgi:4-hydroxybenzoate polyprenyltransferase